MRVLVPEDNHPWEEAIGSAADLRQSLPPSPAPEYLRPFQFNSAVLAEACEF